MKIYISTDVEGLAGITDWNMDDHDTVKFRKLYNEQVAWTLQGIQQATNNSQIDEILISDSHARGTNLDYDYLSDIDDRISLISGYPREDYMMSGLDDSFDQIFFVGYHSGIGKLHGNMDHSYSARSAYNVWINGQYQNETTINVAYANELGIPVTLVIGDSALQEQLVDEKMCPTPKVVVTKKSLNRFSAMSYPRKQVKADIINGAKEVIDNPAPYTAVQPLSKPLTLKIQLANTAKADAVEQMQDVTRVDGRTVEVQCPSMKALLNEIIAIVMLAGTQD